MQPTPREGNALRRIEGTSCTVQLHGHDLPKTLQMGPKRGPLMRSK
jgi:methyl coenzyme M reductase subunit D